LIENGIHYSVQPDLWRLIFHVAQRLNVQVFATSHSWDCLKAFQIAADENKEEEGVLVRLDHADDGVLTRQLNERDLGIAVRDQIEIR
jgi:predicted ATP-dependent endonuclease of OLD family